MKLPKFLTLSAVFCWGGIIAIFFSIEGLSFRPSIETNLCTPPLTPTNYSIRNSRRSQLSAKKCISDMTDEELVGRRVLLRCDLNVPISNGVVGDDTRLRACVPTIEFLTNRQAKVLLLSHFGRPKGQKEDKWSLKPVGKKLADILGKEVPVLDDCIGSAVHAAVGEMKNGDVVLLENVRFHEGETKNDPEFSQKLAAYADIYVNDAFGAAHRAHSSTEGVAKICGVSLAGLLMQKEIECLQAKLDNPARPFAAVIGGSKVSSKLAVLERLLTRVDKLVIGGAMAFTFLKARGYETGKSLVELDMIPMAQKLEVMAGERGVEIVLPTDVVIADQFTEEANSKVVGIDSIPSDWYGMDIGPQTVERISDVLADTKTVFWNGPMGVFEMEPFSGGTVGVASTMAKITSRGAITIVGGGESAAAMNKSGMADKVTHISTGGGAALEMVEGRTLPGVAALVDA